MPLRVAAISFLNPAPLLYNFEHEPAASRLRTRYTVHYTSPARCAAEVHAGDADLGLIPVAELTSDLAVVPGCTIASLEEVRSILLLVRCRQGQSDGDALRSIRSLVVDTASRSSTAYVKTLLGEFYETSPALVQHPADPLPMLALGDAALLIGDPALLARERRTTIDHASAPEDQRLLWLDIAQLWRQHTGLPWVAAVWAVRPASLAKAGVTPSALVADLNASRDAGMNHTEDLVTEWKPRLALSEQTIRTYLTRNIHYVLDENCLRAIRLFRTLAAQQGVLPPLPELPLLEASETSAEAGPGGITGG